MINNIWFKTIAGKINKIPEFYTIFARKMPDYIIRQRDRGQAETKTLRLRPNFGLEATLAVGLEDLTSLHHTRRHHAIYRCNVTSDTRLTQSLARAVNTGAKKWRPWTLVVCILAVCTRPNNYFSSHLVYWHAVSASAVRPECCRLSVDQHIGLTVTRSPLAASIGFLYSTAPSSVSCLTDVSWFLRTVYTEVANSLQTKGRNPHKQTSWKLVGN